MTTGEQALGVNGVFESLAGSAVALEWLYGTDGFEQQGDIAEHCVLAGLEFLIAHFAGAWDQSLPIMAQEVTKLIDCGRIIVQIQQAGPGAESLRVPSVTQILTAEGERTVLMVPHGWVNDVLAPGSPVCRVEALASMVHALVVAEHFANREQYLLRMYEALGSAGMAFGGCALPTSDVEEADMEDTWLRRASGLSAWSMAVSVLKGASGYHAGSEPFISWLSGPPRFSTVG